MFKKLSALVLLAVSSGAYAELPCPTNFDCTISNDGKQVQCSELPAGWVPKIYPGPTFDGDINGQTATVGGVTWSKPDANPAKITCSYEQFPLQIELDGTTTLTPDTSDAWGWVWKVADKTSAYCGGACLIK